MSLVILNQGQTVEAEAKILFSKQSLRTYNFGQDWGGRGHCHQASVASLLLTSHEMSCDQENGYKPWRGLQTTVMVTFPLLPSFWWHVPLFQKELCLIIFVFCNPVLYSFHACDKKGRKKAECELVSLAKMWSITRSVLQHLDRDQVNTEYAYCTSLVILNQGQTLEAEANILFLRQSSMT